jgi:hypothetical protein
MRTLKSSASSLAEARRIISEFIARYNTEWLIERLGHQTPVAARIAAIGGMTDETPSHSNVRIDDRGWWRYLGIPLACPRNRERYSPALRTVRAVAHAAPPATNLTAARRSFLVHDSARRALQGNNAGCRKLPRQTNYGSPVPRRIDVAHAAAGAMLAHFHAARVA